ncbi:MAG: hypothetical protein WC295_14180, partial [Methanoregula sp.]
MKCLNLIVAMSLVILFCLACSPVTANNGENGTFVMNGSVESDNITEVINGTHDVLPNGTPGLQSDIPLFSIPNESVFMNGSVGSDNATAIINETQAIILARINPVSAADTNVRNQSGYPGNQIDEREIGPGLPPLTWEINANLPSLTEKSAY